ncbi:hypothetical protein VHEMI03982 [[Torrubiella] hemipterigena]|uniref:Uncharacterized protein n=1 Tax=[Torrubiella] hemipterigena TaxID=1531966 RepID=A0A0A1TF14_9HYPO|nr:hypothetical protein VHEMI03982 [[Torrubiella] hemipterigena]
MFAKLRSESSAGLPGSIQHDTDHNDVRPPDYNSELHNRPQLKHSFTSTSISSTYTIRPTATKGVSDPLGLQIAYQPKDTAGDIVFVHGLNGSAWKSWSVNSDLDSFWPQWLSDDETLSRYRVSTFGYSSKVKSSSTNLDIVDFATNLLVQLFAILPASSNGTSRPLIFVAHSMGGLVVKKAVMMGKQDQQFSAIISNVRAIMFLATPHRGSHYAKTLSNILAIAPLGLASKTYINDLKWHGSALHDINENFKRHCDNIHLCSFFETLKSSVGLKQILIVEKESAVLGYPGELSAALEANHKDICKYTSKLDPNFLTVKGILSQWAAQFQSTNEQIVSPDIPQNPQTVHPHNWLGQVKRIFGLETMADDRLETPLKTVHNSHNAGRWLIARKQFEEWFQLNPGCIQSKTLLLIGPPGTGKSVLCQSVIGHLRSIGAEVQHHAFNKTHQLKQTGSFCLRSIAAQLAISHPQFQHAIMELHEKTGVRFNQDHSFQFLWEHLFEQVLFKINGQNPIYLVLDSIDESDSTIPILQRFSEVESCTPIKIFASCRPVKGVPIGGISPIVPYFLQPEDTASDMDDYVTRTVQQTLPDDLETQKFVQWEIMKRSGGSFLWAKLALEMLQDSWHTREDIISTLTEVPSGMTAMYSRMVDLIKAQGLRNQDIARKILMWVACSWRPLYIAELQEALKASYGTFTNLALTITQICGHFVTIDRSDDAGPRAVLIHVTAKEFLTDTRQLGSLCIDAKHGHKEITETCLSYLCNDRWRGRLSTMGGLSTISDLALNTVTKNRLLAASTEFPLLPYATWHWAYHLNKSPLDDFSSLEMLETFMLNYSLSWLEAIAVSGDMSHVIRSAKYLKSYVKKTSKTSWSNTRWIKVWATDFIRIASKFAANLVVSPSSVYRNIPPMCPKSSMIGRAFSLQSADALTVRGFAMETWDDCLASVVLENDEYVAHVVANDSLFFTLGGFSKNITVWNSDTCEKVRDLDHGELVNIMFVGNSGTKLVAASFGKFHIWDGASGRVLHQVAKSIRSRVHDLIISPNEKEVLAAFENFKVEHIDIESGQSWRQDLDVTSLDSGYQNCPICQAISPDGTKIVMGWRGRPPLVWDLTSGNSGTPLKCRSTTMSGSIMSTKKLVWCPDSSKVFIICQDTSVFEWKIFEDELSECVQVKARHLSISADGTLLLTSDNEGTISIWTLPRLSLIYSLQKNGDLINALTFSSDHQRFYDIRNGSSCNIWEPDALVRTDDQDLEDTGSMNGSLPTTEAVISTQGQPISTITAITVGPNDTVYACAYNGGSVIIHESAHGAKVRKVYSHPSSQKITALSWSPTGKYMASCDVTSHVIIKRLQFKDDGKWAVFPVLDFRLGYASPQLFFSPDEKFMMSFASTKIDVWNMKSKEKIWTKSRNEKTDWYWASGPLKSNNLFCLGVNGISEIVDWANGNEQVEATPNSLHPQSVFERLAEPKADIIITDTVVQQHIIWTALISGGQHFVVATVEDANGRWAAYYRNLRLSVVKMATSAERPQQISPEICRKIKLLLGVKGNDLLFLGFDGWVCSYNISSLINGRQRRLSTGVMVRQEDVEGFKRHFYIPRDWLNTTSANAVSNSEGTLFFPKQGEVAIVRNGLRFE